MYCTPNDRLTYKALTDVPGATFPEGVRLVVWIIVNVEYWDIANPMPRAVLPPPMGQMRIPDIANWGWHEYGMRRGFWRLKDALDSRNITPTLSINGHVCEAYPQIASAAHDSGWEFMGHSFKQIPMHNLDDEAKEIERTVEAIRKFTGAAPRGWLGPGLTETHDTLDLLSDNGIDYVGDFSVDDLPVPLKTRSGREMTAMPYTLELNDIPIYCVEHHTAAQFQQRCSDQFDRLYQEAEEEPRILSIAVHPFLSGVPHRIAYFERVLDMLSGRKDVAFWTGEQLLDWHLNS